MTRDKNFDWRRVDTRSLDLEGMKVAIVGGTGGIGRALSRLLVSRGAAVLVVGRTFRDSNGPLLLGGGLDRDSAASLIAQRAADAAVFGSLYLANPDLLQRFAAGAPLNAPDRETFYSDGPRGYVDYPVLGQTLEVGQVDWRGAARA